MLRIDNLSKTYAKSATKAVDGLSLELKEGEIFGFLGPNGAGKSTTIKCITGIQPYDSGSVSICGRDLKSDPVSAKLRMGYVPDQHVIYDKLKGMEYLNFMADMYGVSTSDRRTRIDALLERFNLASAINSPIKSYSHGMKQKVSVIGALLHEPKLWILDEPLTGLDPQAAYELKELMREHCLRGNTVFFSSHVLEVVEKVCDRVGIINQGRLISVLDVKELKDKRSDSTLEEFFLSLTGGNKGDDNE